MCVDIGSEYLDSVPKPSLCWVFLRKTETYRPSLFLCIHLLVCSFMPDIDVFFTSCVDDFLRVRGRSEP